MADERNKNPSLDSNVLMFHKTFSSSKDFQCEPQISSNLNNNPNYQIHQKGKFSSNTGQYTTVFNHIPEEDSVIEFQDQDEAKRLTLSISNITLFDSRLSSKKDKRFSLGQIENNFDVDFEFKVVLLGDFNVGKSSFLEAITKLSSSVNSDDENKIDGGYNIKPYNQVSLLLYVNNESTVKLNIWDTAGEEKYNSVPGNYLRNTNGIFLMFDTTNRFTFYSLRKWLKIIRESTEKATPMILIGTKQDLKEREVTFDEASFLAKQLEIDYIEISTLQNMNIEISIEFITRCIILSLEESVVIKETPMKSKVIIDSTVKTYKSSKKTDSFILGSHEKNLTKRQSERKKANDSCC